MLKKVIVAKKGVGSGAGSVSQRYGSTDPDLYQNVTDPQHSSKVSKNGIPGSGSTQSMDGTTWSSHKRREIKDPEQKHGFRNLSKITLSICIPIFFNRRINSEKFDNKHKTVIY